MGFDFEIQYKPRLANKAVDALLKVMSYHAISMVTNLELTNLVEKILADEVLKKIMQQLLACPTSHSHYSIEHGCLWYKQR